MVDCLMNEYIKLTKKHINEYAKLVFERKLNRELNNKYLEEYINTRYYGFSNGDLTFRNTVLETLDKIKESLINKKEYNDEDIKLLCDFYKNVAYIEGIVPNKNLKNVENNIEKLKEKIFKKVDLNFKSNLHKLIIENDIEIDNLLARYETRDFYLKFSNYKDKSNIQRVNLKYNIKLPTIYSDLAIQRAFNETTVNEDKLMVEYNLINLQIIKDIKKGNFKKHYILEYAETLLRKQQKNTRILKVLYNPIIQEKVSLKLKYSSFINNKELVYDIIRNGFNIAIIIDDEFKPTVKEIEGLGVFKHILIHKDNLKYAELVKNMSKVKNIIEI